MFLTLPVLMMLHPDFNCPTARKGLQIHPPHPCVHGWVCGCALYIKHKGNSPNGPRELPHPQGRPQSHSLSSNYRASTGPKASLTRHIRLFPLCPSHSTRQIDRPRSLPPPPYSQTHATLQRGFSLARPIYSSDVDRKHKYLQPHGLI